MKSVISTVFIGMILNIISVTIGIITFSGNLFYDSFIILSIFIITSVFFMPHYKYEVSIFLLLQPFWAYTSRYNIFSIEFGSMLIDLQLLYVIFWSLKYLNIGSIRKGNKLEKLNILALFFISFSFVLSMINTYDNKANIIGFIYGVVSPYLIYKVTKDIFIKFDRKDIIDTFVLITRVIIFHDVFTIFVEFSSQTFFNIESQYGRITGIFGNTLFITLINIYAIAFSFYLIRKDNVRSIRIQSILGLIIYVVTILLTASRGGILIVILAFISYFVLIEKVVIRFKYTLVGIVVSLFSIYVFKTYFVDSYNILIERGFSSNFTETSRLIYQFQSIEYVLNNFIQFFISGVGVANFHHLYYSLGGIVVTSAHNFLVTTLVELGFVSTLSYFVVIVYSILYKNNRYGKYISVQILTLLLYGLIVGGSISLLPTAGYDYSNILNLYTILLYISLGMKAGLSSNRV